MKCPNCESDEVYHDVAEDSISESYVSTTVRKWYDCLSCGTRILKKDITRHNTYEQEEPQKNRVSDFEINPEYLK